jgi:hypothetical protein
MADNEMTTNQAKQQRGGNRNPAGKGGFGDNPQNRSDGRWKSEDSISYQYKKFMRMTPIELKAYANVPDTDRTVAQDLAYRRVVAAQKSLPDMKEITDRTEGRALQSIDHTNDGEKFDPIVIYRPEKLDD